MLINPPHTSRYAESWPGKFSFMTEVRALGGHWRDEVPKTLVVNPGGLTEGILLRDALLGKRENVRIVWTSDPRY